jgi:Cof subfamily protein (haloacid dehalogenase superfamily)
MEHLSGLAFFDLDGTLLDGNSKITREVAHALTEMKNNGVLPIIASGRTVFEIKGIMQDAGIDSVIAMNGMYIQAEGKEIYSNTIAPQETHHLLKFARTLKNEIAYCNANNIWLSSSNDPLSEHYSFMHGSEPLVNAQIIEKEPINMLLVGSDNPENDLLYQENFPNLTFFRNSPYAIDTVKSGVDKGTGVIKMIELLHANHLPTYSFGDGGNDFKLLEATKYKIAMGNALPELKEQATFVTKKNTENGIVHALKYYELIR